MIDDFTVYSSNNLAVTNVGGVNVFQVLMTHRSALTFASQVDQHTLQTIPNPNKFGNLVRGMSVYGHETVKPEAMVNAYVSIRP